MKSVVVQYLNRLDASEKVILMDQFESARRLYNRAIYLSRQYYFNEKDIISYERCYSILKDSDDYKWLNSNIAQHVLKEVNGTFRAFFNLLKQAKSGRFNYHNIILPSYLSGNKFIPIVVRLVRLTKENELVFPLSRMYKKTLRPLTISVPPILHGKKITRAIITYDGKLDLFKIAYEYKVEVSEWELDPQHVLAIDFGLNNMATCVTNRGESFIVDGKRMKDRNRKFNELYYSLKKTAESQLIEDMNGNYVPIPLPTKQMRLLMKKRNHQITDEFFKAARYIVNYCLKNDIGRIVMGYPNVVELYRTNSPIFNENYSSVPVGNLRHKIEDLCERYQIKCIFIDESYTSDASFFDSDKLPDYNDDNPKDYQFSGKRIARGTYKTKAGCLVNSDINAALNILAKSNLVDVSKLRECHKVKIPQKVLLP